MNCMKRIKSSEPFEFDLIVFSGQSNMAGRGCVSEQWPQRAAIVTEGAGYEYRAISAPDILSEVIEPFGVNENKEGFAF